jgi:REP-associated tyrosine transposase
LILNVCDQRSWRGYNGAVPQLRRYYGQNHLHFLTTGTYRRARVFDSERFKRRFIATLGKLRSELDFLIVGYVLMPEHIHLLLWPGERANPSQIMQKLEGRTARFILKALRENRENSWCQRMLGRFTLPSTVHDEAHFRVWQRRFYDMNIWTEKKILEKLNYMHNNPVQRSLVKEPGEWPWSSWRFYYLEDASLLAMDRVP